jgi:glyoxylase I family protein
VNPMRFGVVSITSGTTNKEVDMPAFPSLTHVAITVRDLSVSAPWYRRLIGAEPVIDEDTDAGYRHVVFALENDTLLGLHQHTQSAPREEFSEFRVGLDHVAFACPSREELEKWAGRLDELGVEHGGVVDASYGSGLSFRDPDGSALEFFAPPV